jgi:2-polyprenyl-6-hydroxyphenyl methylase/3-demethylubiquinone-9 3-methyltransferase
MTHDDLHGIRFGYLRRVLSERWPVPSRTPTMLAVSRDSSVVAADFARLGFRVEGIGPQDASLESLSQRLAGRTADFDVVCCWDVLEHGDDWPAIVGVMARALRSGGVFFYSVRGRAKGSWSFVNRLTRLWREDPDEVISPRDLHATLRQQGLLPQRAVALDHGVSRPAMSRAVRDRVVSYTGYAFRRRDRPASLTDGCWRFRTTLEQWVYVPAEREQGGTSRPRRRRTG